MKVAIIGCGYVGVTTGVGLSLAGHKVSAIDVCAERVSLLRAGRLPFFEPELDMALKEVLRSGTFRPGSSLNPLQEADVVMLCVGTPCDDNGAIDLSSLRQALLKSLEVMRTIDRYQVIAIRSTAIPGTSERLALPLIRKAMRSRTKPIGLAYNPEFLREGSALRDFTSPDRVIIGEANQQSGDLVSSLYEGFHVPVIRTSLATAEMTKYTTNALLATLISFSNEIARICEAIPGVDVEDVLQGLHTDRRLVRRVNGKPVPVEITEYLKAGCGFGGSCLPKDLHALINFAETKGIRPIVLQAVEVVNQSQTSHVVNLAERWVGGLSDRKVLVLGLSFKAGTDDIRNSSGIAIAKTLIKRGASVVVADPHVVQERVRDLIDLGVEFANDVRAAFAGCEVCFITTAAPDFRFVEEEISRGDPRTKMPVVIDGRRFLDGGALRKTDRYLGIGIGPRAMTRYTRRRGMV